MGKRIGIGGHMKETNAGPITSSGPPSTHPEDPTEFRRWDLVYLAVVLNTALTILLLWIFSEAFTP